ncbi:HAMP domain-containing histidine kinase [Tissierella carlieri]|uniref:histidine kinase n=2 Tax=Tissierella carlieri TaxID=689904 RepID=A0ABT1S841_9FIRM|nr:HAMP domain-containing histidine kinase [Tissierella carlieri]
MRLHLTLKYLMSIIMVIIVVGLVNGLIAFGLFQFGPRESYSYGIANESYISPEDYVRQFSKYISLEEGRFSLDKNAQRSLIQNDAWIQVLDINYKVNFQFNGNKELPQIYTPMTLVHNYKYANPDTMFVSEVSFEEETYTYLIGMPYNDIQRTFFTFNKTYFASIIGGLALLVFAVDLVLGLLFGMGFSRGLTKPVGEIIKSIEDLTVGYYNQVLPTNGLYGSVFSNINKLSDQLQANEKERVAIDAMRESWISNISHDIKTPLASIRGYGELLHSDEKMSVENMRRYAKVIEDKALYISNLVDDLNLSTRLESGYFVLNLQMVNIVTLLRDIVIDVLNGVDMSNVYLDWCCDEIQILCQLDPVLFRRAINNILYNAIIHNDKSVNIKVKLTYEENKIYIWVADDGKGISPEDLPYIFNRHYRGTNTSNIVEGTGLGMTITKQIIKAHGGEISVNGELGIGTCFEVVLIN